MIRFNCPECDMAISVKEQFAGKIGKCTGCKKEVRIPDSDTNNAGSTVEPPVKQRRFADPLPMAFAGMIAVILLIQSAAFATQFFGLGSTKTATTRWEYKLEAPSDIEFASEINKMGEDGWELVSARRATSISDKASYEMIFKRPKR